VEILAATICSCTASRKEEEEIKRNKTDMGEFRGSYIEDSSAYRRNGVEQNASNG
jgi:hypothetical protein